MYSELSNRHNTVYGYFQNLSRQINNAAVINPDLVKAGYSTKGEQIFFTDSLLIIQQLDLLKSTVRDSVSIIITKELDTSTRLEISWLLKSNVPDSIIKHKSPEHIASFQRTDSLINQGIHRTLYLIEYGKQELNDEINKLKIWMIAFILLSGMLYLNIMIHFRQQSKRKVKEKELENVFNRINDAVVSVNNDWRYTFLNDAALATHPGGKETTLGKVIWDIHPEMNGTIFWEKYHEAMDTRKVVEIESYYAPMDTWFSVKVYPSDDGLTIFYKDITKNKKLEEQQALYALIVNSSDEAIISKNLEGIITSWNNGAEKAFGYSASEIIGKPISVLIPANLLNEEKNIIEKIKNGESVDHYETERIKKNGEIINVSLTVSPIRDSHGNIIGASKILRNVSERKRAEEEILMLNKELIKSAQKFKGLVENGFDLLTICDENFNVFYRGPAATKILGWTDEDRKKKAGHDEIHPEDISNFMSAFKEALSKQGKPISVNCRALHKLGHYVSLEGSFTNMLHDESIKGVIANFHDVTERKKAEEKILKLNEAVFKSEKRFRGLIENSDDMITMLDRNGKTVYVSPAVVKKFGYSYEESLTLNATDIIHPDDMPIAGAFMNEVMQHPSVAMQCPVIRNVKKDGTFFWVEGTLTNFLETEGINAIVSNFRDISERKRSEEEVLMLNKEITKSEKRFRGLIENSYDIVSISDSSFKPFYRSPSSVRITGWTNEERANTNTDDQIHPDDIEKLKETIKDVINNPAIAFPVSFRIKHKTGHYISLDGMMTNMLQNEAIKGIVGNFRDVTETRIAEEKIRESEKIYRTIASSIPGSVICLLDKDYRYLLIEGDMLEKLGYSKEKLLGNKVIDVINADRYAELLPDFERVFSGETFTRDYQQGEYYIVNSYVPLKDESNKVYAALLVLFDVTELKKAERSLAELNVELEEKVIVRTAQFKAVNQELENFTYSVSHDLRAPLRIIDGYGQILLEDYSQKLDEEGQRTIETIMNSAQKMGQLIDDLLNFSKLGRSELRVAAVNMNKLVDQVLLDLNFSDISIPRLLTRYDLEPAIGDNNLLKQVWVNLISNAIKYSSRKADPEIEIGMMKDKNKHIYYVKDNGAGFDMQYAGKLFGVFQRLHREKDFPGTGVGLALVQRIIVRHGGTIWADAKENEGAVFYFTLAANHNMLM
ncbi:MAG: PAS domain S-box protein [Bacteroidota bacterium]